MSAPDDVKAMLDAEWNDAVEACAKRVMGEAVSYDALASTAGEAYVLKTIAVDVERECEQKARALRLAAAGLFDLRRQR